MSDKVFLGCVKIAQQGFRAGGLPPYGLKRLLLDEMRKPVQILKPGQRKSIQNQRVTLAPGEQNEISVINRIFEDFVRKHREPFQIAQSLNSDAILSPGNKKWTASTVVSILKNELYIGTMIYNKTGQRLQSPTKKNPHEEWIRKPNAFEAIVDREIFLNAQQIMAEREAERKKLYSNEDMIQKLKLLYDRHGIISRKQIDSFENMLSTSTYVKHFASLDMAFQQMFSGVLDRTRKNVVQELQATVKQVEPFEDYLVLNDSLSLIVQPSVPVPYGYGAYWSFRPDCRTEIDVTLGVPLSNNGEYNILGYLAFPRLFCSPQNIKLFSSSDGTLDMHGYQNIDLLNTFL